MKKGMQLVAMVLVVTMMMGLTACGSGGKGVDKTYTAKFDNTMDETILEAIPEYQFVAADLSGMISYGVNLDVTLKLSKDGTYALESKYYNQEPTTKETDAGYMDVRINATGTYTKENDQITISAAKTATATYQGGAYITEQGMFLPYSFNEDGSVGEWSGESVPDVLKCVPETVFTVTEDNQITTWKASGEAKGNPHAQQVQAETTQATDATATDATTTEATTEAATTEETTEAVVATEAAVATTGFVMKSPEWPAVSLTFNEDGTFIFELPDYSITENGTWAYADQILTITKSNGTTATSTMEGDSMKISYVAVASDQLVGNFVSTDWNTFFK